VYPLLRYADLEMAGKTYLFLIVTNGKRSKPYLLFIFIYLSFFYSSVNTVFNQLTSIYTYAQTGAEYQL
jgi:hypothetical protein